MARVRVVFGCAPPAPECSHRLCWLCAALGTDELLGRDGDHQPCQRPHPPSRLASALPVVGNPLVSWLWGGLSVENATLNRFLSLHYLLPFFIAGNSVVHLAALHQYGSNHPLVGANPVDKSAF